MTAQRCSAAQIRMMQTLRRKAGLDDEAWRARLKRDAQVTSTRAVSVSQAIRIIDGLKRETGVVRKDDPRMDGPYAPKLRALWIAGWNLGVVRDRRDPALLAFVKRQTGLEAVRFLHDAEDAMKAIEALKTWLTRDGGVDWGKRGEAIYSTAWRNNPRAQVVLAQFTRLHKAGVLPFDLKTAIGEILGVAKPFEELTDAEWQQVSNRLGEDIRKLKKTGAGS